MRQGAEKIMMDCYRPDKIEKVNENQVRVYYHNELRNKTDQLHDEMYIVDRCTGIYPDMINYRVMHTGQIGVTYRGEELYIWPIDQLYKFKNAIIFACAFMGWPLKGLEDTGAKKE
jgi:hypothetical protein